MSPRPSHYATLHVERVEDRINMSGTSSITALVGGSAALTAQLSLDTNFLQGFTNTQSLLNALGGPSDLGHVIVDTNAIFGTVYGGSYLASARTDLSNAIQALGQATTVNSTLISNFGAAAQHLAYVAGAAYAVEQDLVAHGVPAIGAISAIGTEALQKVQNAAIATYNSAVDIVGSLNALSTETVNQAVKDLSRQLAAPVDPTLGLPPSPPVSPPPPTRPPDGDDNVDGDDGNY